MRRTLSRLLAGVLLWSCSDTAETDVRTIDAKPDTLTLAPAASIQLTAATRDRYGVVIARPVTWRVLDTSVARISAVGRVTGVAPGFTLVFATSEGVSDTTQLAVAPIVRVTPRYPSLFAEDTMQLVAALMDGLGQPFAGTVTWSTSDPAVATVSPGGVLTAYLPGMVRITAQSQGGEGVQEVAILEQRIRPNRELIVSQIEGPWSRLWMAAAGATPQRLLSNDSTVGSWHPSPDGERLVVSLPRSGTAGGTFVTFFPSGEQRIIPFTTSWARWSPSGQSIAYERGGSAAGVRIMTPDGLNELLLSGPSSTPAAWSPDGRQLAFGSLLDGGDLVVVSIGGDRRLIRLGSVTGDVVMSASWSPDGRRLLVATDTALWMLRGDGTNPVRFCPPVLGCVVSYHFEWSPSGQHLLLYSGGGFRVLTADGAVSTAIVPADCPPCTRWSPDGTTVAYLRMSTTPDSLGIWGVGPDGDNARRLVALPQAFYTGIRWRP